MSLLQTNRVWAYVLSCLCFQLFCVTLAASNRPVNFRDHNSSPYASEYRRNTMQRSNPYYGGAEYKELGSQEDTAGEAVGGGTKLKRNPANQYQSTHYTGNRPQSFNAHGAGLNSAQVTNNRNELVEPNPAVVDWVKNMCKIWVPDEAVSKYAQASIIQHDQATRTRLIEVCCTGFAPVRWRGTTLCRPTCDNCRNGFCVAPNKCECYEGFVPNDNGDCVFTCPLGCLNGRCYLDGSCQCDPGYKLDETRKYCRPICNDYCNTNSRLNCTAPGECGCAKGYTLNEIGCLPTCNMDCGVGGTCREPDVCECDPGYENLNGICQAKCYQNCANGVCISPNRCICNTGYVYHERSTQCIPT